MEEKKESQIICPYAHMQDCSPVADDEINLLDFWNVLWGRRLLILVVTVLITAAASSYAFFSPKIYEVKVNIHSSFDLGVGAVLTELEAINSSLQINPTGVFKRVQKNLQDRTVQTKFWAESEIVKRLMVGIESHEVNALETWFMQNLLVKLPLSKKGNQGVLVSLTGRDPDVMVEVLNDFISYVDDYSSTEEINILKLKLAKIELVSELQLKKLRGDAEINILRRIAELNEQKAIAEKLKMIIFPEDIVGKPLYARGVDSLQAEIDILRQRKNSDLFIDGLSVEQERLRKINKSDFDLNNVSISTMQAETAIVPRQPKKPKQHLIIVLGLIIGLMVGISSAFLMNFVGSMRQREPEE